MMKRDTKAEPFLGCDKRGQRIKVGNHVSGIDDKWKRVYGEVVDWTNFYLIVLDQVGKRHYVNHNDCYIVAQ